MENINDAISDDGRQQTPATCSFSPIVNTLCNYDSISLNSIGTLSVVESEYMAAEIDRLERLRQINSPLETSSNLVNLQINVMSGN